MPDNGAGFVKFLSTEKEFVGIGIVKAQLLWEQFRSGIFGMLECEKNTPYKQDKSISNFQAIKDVLRRDDTVNALYEGFKKYANLKYVSQLVEWEVEEPAQRQLFRFADKDAISFLKANPYRLFSLGMRFNKVDDIAQKHFGIRLDDKIRLVAIIEQSLRQWSDKGHTVAHWNDIENIVKKKHLNNDQSLVEKSKLLTGDIIGFVKQDDKYYVSGNYIFEKTIAKRFSKLSKRESHWQSDLDTAFINSIPNGWRLEDAQSRAVRTALISHIFALSGGAGTGKTTTTKLIVDAYQQLGFTIYPVALSGKAVRRLQQSIGIDCMTIARLLREDRIVENSVLLIDEASMLDAYTMWRLVTLFSDKTRIILVGDPYQLPPINAGLILNDVIKSGVVNHVELDVVRRQGATSTVPEYSNSIRHGNKPSSLTTSDITFHESSGDMLQDAVAVYSKYKSAMIVASTNATVRSVNIKLQQEMNANGRVLELTDMPITKGSYEFREGDPVVITLTCYKNDVQNGTLGVITSAVATDEYACVI